jgi:hypothetical protein
VGVTRAKEVLPRRIFHVSRTAIQEKSEQAHTTINDGGEHDEQNPCRAARFLAEHDFLQFTHSRDTMVQIRVLR